MKIVIVEDEPNIRSGLNNIIEKYTGHQVVALADNGLTGAEEIRRHKPDLVLCDIMMPGMNGLEMLETLHGQGMEFFTIMLTGYSDFDYARRALHLEVVDYLLKPLDVQELLECIEKVENKLENHAYARATLSQLLYDLRRVSPQQRPAVLRILKERLQLDEGEQASLFLFVPAGYSFSAVDTLQKELEPAIEGVFMGDYHLCRLPGGEGVFAILLSTRQNASLCRMIQQNVLPQLNCPSGLACVHAPLQSIDQLEQTITDMDEMWRMAIAFPRFEILTREKVQGVSYQEAPYPSDAEHNTRKAIRCGNYDKAHQLVEGFCSFLFTSGLPPQRINEYALRFGVRVLDAIVQWCGVQNLSQTEYQYNFLIQSIANCLSREDLQQQLTGLVDIARENNLSGDVTSPETRMLTENEIILKVLAFIRKNYGDNITLTDAASLVGITPEYLSKLFTDEIKLNFVAFLREFRVSEAKRMLASDKYKIYEIAQKTGFQDVKYFNKVFKSVCGVSPSEYRRGAQ